MKVLEYKLHMTATGLVHPDWIVDGGYFFNGNSYIAVVPNDADRLYYVPDTLIELTLSDLVSRAIAIQNNNDTTDSFVDPNDFHRLTDAELTTYINAWWAEKVGV